MSRLSSGKAALDENAIEDLLRHFSKSSYKAKKEDAHVRTERKSQKTKSIALSQSEVLLKRCLHLFGRDFSVSVRINQFGSRIEIFFVANFQQIGRNVRSLSARSHSTGKRLASAPLAG